MAPPQVPLAGGALLMLFLAVALGAVPPCESAALRLRGSVTCLDCAPGHDLSGVVVAVKCGRGDDGAGLHAAQTDGRGNFDVAVSASSSASPCAARVLGATEQLCAPQRLTVARVVPARPPASASSNSSYVLGSRLAFFTRCAAAASGSGSSTAVATTMANRDRQGNALPEEPELRPTPAVRPPSPVAGRNSPPVAFGGLPLIFFFPFIPIIGIP